MGIIKKGGKRERERRPETRNRNRKRDRQRQRQREGDRLYIGSQTQLKKKLYVYEVKKKTRFKSNPTLIKGSTNTYQGLTNLGCSPNIARSRYTSLLPIKALPFPPPHLIHFCPLPLSRRRPLRKGTGSRHLGVRRLQTANRPDPTRPDSLSWWSRGRVSGHATRGRGGRP